MKVKGLLSSKEKWIQGCYARDKDGKGVAANDPDATCWCLMGAIRKCYSGADYNEKLRMVETVILNIPYFNDASTFDAVKHLVERLDI